MITLQQQFQQKNRRTLEQIDEVYAFKNKQAPYMIFDTNYWLFGDMPPLIPEGYCADDPDIMTQYQLEKIIRHYQTPAYEQDCYYGYLMPWFGTGVLASAFGTKVEMLYKMDPAVHMSDIHNPEQIDALKLPNPYKDGLMPRVLQQIDYFKQQCDLPIGVTDCQGPLTTALSIVGYENFMYWMYDYPEAIHKLMQLCTDSLINWVKTQKKHIGVPDAEPSFILGFRMPSPNGGIWISDDDSVIMPSDLFAEFVVPYNEQILLAFGGGGIHYCGNSNQNTENYMQTKGLYCLHNLHLDDFDAAKKVRTACLNHNIVYCLGDFTPDDARLDSYFDTIYGQFEQQGMAVISYIAPAIALLRGKYEAITRDQHQLGQLVQTIISQKQKIYI